MSTIDRLSGSLSSVAIKPPVRVATTGPVALSGLQTIDGVALGAGDRVLVRNQANAIENGIWIVHATAWRRATDFNGSRDAVTGTEIGVVAGSTWGGQRFQIAAPDPVVIGLSPLSFVVMGQGPTGAVGPTGPLGPTGPQGAPGTTTVTGGVLGPVSSTIGNVARWNDAAGGALNDGGVAVSNLVTLSGSQTVSGNKTLSGSTLFSGAVQFEAGTVVYASDSGASAAPQLTLRRQSASPAANDVMASVEFVGNDSGGNLTAYAQLQGMIVSPTNGSEAGGLDVMTLVGGSAVRQGRFGSGLLLGTATGGFQGTGTVNATAYYVNGVALGAGTPAGTGALWFTGTAPDGWLLCDGQAVSRSTYAALFAVLGTSYGAGNGSTTFNLPDMRGLMPLGAGSGAIARTISAVNTGNEQLTVTGHGFFTGQMVRYASTSGAIGGLSSGTDYYVVVATANAVQLATSRANALAGTAINLTSSGSGTQTLTANLASRSLGARGGEEEHALSVSEMPAHRHDPLGAGEGPGVFGLFHNNQWSSASPATAAGNSEVHNNMPPFLVVNFIVKT